MRQLLVLGLLFLPVSGFSATLSGETLSLVWGLPFAAMLLSIALLPLLLPALWHHHYGKIALVLALFYIAPCVIWIGADVALSTVMHAVIEEYIPFILLLAALFVVAGGICIRGNFIASPKLNTSLLAIGTVAASIMGTTGAAMLLIHPLIRANLQRKYNVHVLVFFIFLVANAGGILTPLGDPPLFLGFLKGVDFFWMIKHVLPHTIFLWCALLLIFYCLDTYLYQKEGLGKRTSSSLSVRFEGKCNFVLLAAIIGSVLLSGVWKSSVSFSIAGATLTLPSLVRDILLIMIIGISLKVTPKSARDGNGFSWEPMKEVAKLFIGIFITMIPVISILRAGEAGALGGVIHAVTDATGEPNNVMYFWITGLLSAFLDNAPTYLVFFNTASGDAVQMMTTYASTLIAISLGAVFMGAVSYIGNAPNLMVKAIAEEKGIKMPSFFGYIAWSVCILVPLFAILTWLFIA